MSTQIGQYRLTEVDHTGPHRWRYTRSSTAILDKISPIRLYVPDWSTASPSTVIVHESGAYTGPLISST